MAALVNSRCFYTLVWTRYVENSLRTECCERTRSMREVKWFG